MSATVPLAEPVAAPTPSVRGPSRAHRAARRTWWLGLLALALAPVLWLRVDSGGERVRAPRVIEPDALLAQALAAHPDARVKEVRLRGARRPAEVWLEGEAGALVERRAPLDGALLDTTTRQPWLRPLGREAWAGLGAGVYLGFCGLLVHRRRTVARRDAAALASTDADTWRVLHASQTGQAEALATAAARALHLRGQEVTLQALGGLAASGLAGMRRVIVVASTTGEGDAPDPAEVFERRWMHAPVDLSGMTYALLALGDRRYRDFCAFAHRLDAWLQASGARPLHPCIEVDDGDPEALAQWGDVLGSLGAADVACQSAGGPVWSEWRVTERRVLNPGSVGAPVGLVALRSATGAEQHWDPGDIAVIRPRHTAATVADWLRSHGRDGAVEVMHDGRRLSLSEALAERQLPPADPAPDLDAQALLDALSWLPQREYSIASLPGDGAIELLVRRQAGPDGVAGHGSATLLERVLEGARMSLRLRANPGFRPPLDARPLILVGSGTGIAGLRALLRARIAADLHENWLVFGERQAGHDLHFGAELHAARWTGGLRHLDLAFSRDVEGRAYVQDRLREQRERLHAWVDRGAVICVCGSRKGMAAGVDAALREILGGAVVDRMLAEGRYRRDVY